VLRDSLGRETTTTLPFYASSMMLRQGLLDFSIEAGMARRNFGISSDDYDGRVMGVATARYGLTDQLTLEAHELLTASDLNFAGNTEGRDLLRGGADVVVTDGFTGNVALKLLEGTIRNLLDAFREESTATTRGKLGGLLSRPAARRLRSRLDPDTYGGAYLLGLRGLAVIAHGNSSRRAITNAIRLAARGVDHDVVGRLAQRVGDTVLESAASTTPTPT